MTLVVKPNLCKYIHVFIYKHMNPYTCIHRRERQKIHKFLFFRDSSINLFVSF